MLRNVCIYFPNNFQKKISPLKIYSFNISTINEQEVNKFSQIGRKWWDKSSIDGSGPLHDMNPIRVAYIREALSKCMGKSISSIDHFKNVKVLDVGCGGGLLSESLARLNMNVTSIDPAKESIEVAKHHSSFDPLTIGIDYRCSSIEEIAEKGEKFDVVCCLEVLEHVDHPMKFISNCIEVLKPNGSLFLSTINRTAKSYAVAIVGAEYISKLVPTGTHDWNKFISPEELELFIKTANKDMKIVSKVGLVPDIKSSLKLYNIIGFNQQNCFKQLVSNWKTVDYDLDVNYIMHAIKH